MRFSTLFFLLFCFCHSFSQNKITYIANEGILIQTENHKILVDALFDDYYKDYEAPSSSVILSMNKGNAPFDNIDFCLHTHSHADHFDAELAGNFMVEHKESIMVTTIQSHESLKAKYALYPQISQRIFFQEHSKGDVKNSMKKMEVIGYFIPHGGGMNVENLAFLIKTDGLSILHIGDAEMDEDKFQRLNIPQMDLDVALIPFWFYVIEDGQKIINKYFSNTKLIAIHVPKVIGEKTLKGINQFKKEAIIFDKVGQEVGF